MSSDLSPRPEKGGSEPLINLRNLTLIIYALYILSIFGGITSLVGIIMNYLKRDEVRGTYLESHFTWQINTFWLGLIGVCVSFLLMFVAIGFVTIWIVGIWIVYRLVKGLLALNDGKPIA